MGMTSSVNRLTEINENVRAYGVDKTAALLGLKVSTVERRLRDYDQMMREHGLEPVPHKTEPKILLFDIENSPSRAWIWSLWNEVRDYKFVTDDWYLLSFSWKWLGGETVCHALPDFDLYKEDPLSDKELLKILHSLLCESDIVVAHNAKKFDVRKVNARFVTEGMKPPSPYKVVDTLMVARKHFMFTSNRLDALGQQLGLGRKVDTGGFELWTGCMDGDMDSWGKMVEYNIQDVDLLEKVYLRLAPYMNNHPNFNAYTDRHGMVCPLCGCQVEEDGYAYTNISKFVRYQCTSCGYWGRGRSSVLDKEKRATVITSVA